MAHATPEIGRDEMIPPNSAGRFSNSLSLSGLFSGENKKPAIILFLAPILLTTVRYYGSSTFYLIELSPWFTLFGDAPRTAELYSFFFPFVVLGLLSLFIIKFVFKEKLSSYGLQLGDWRFGLKAFLVLAPIFTLGSYMSMNNPEFLAQYPVFKGAGASPSMFISHTFAYLVFYAGWEIYFRGLMQYGLRDSFGDWQAILIQTALSCIVHIGKPTSEIYSSIFGGLVWGIVAFRARSIVFVILLHWLLGVSLDFFICYIR
jgi:membrane protease YdiL (CAAX protease family)